MKRRGIIMAAGVFFAFSLLLGIYVTTIYPTLLGLLISAAIGGIAYFKHSD